MVNKNKGGSRLPKLTDQLGHLQIKKENLGLMNSNEQGIDRVIKTLLKNDKRLDDLSIKIENIVNVELKETGKNLKDDIQGVINRYKKRPDIDTNLVKNLINQTIFVVYRDLYEYDDNFRNDVEKNTTESKVNISSLSNLNKNKIRKYIKILLFKSLAILNEEDKEKFSKAIDSLRDVSINPFKKYENDAFKKINEHMEIILKHLSGRINKRENQIKEIYRK
jgi:hypothetical protein